MLIKIGNPPQKSKLKEKHLKILDAILILTKETAKFSNIEFYGFYIRGSVAFGADRKQSDLDIVVLIKQVSYVIKTNFERTLRKLVNLKTWLLPIDIKVFCVTTDAAIEIYETNEIWKNRLTKHVNFDISANAICYSGNSIKNQLDIFSSPAEFRENNRFIWGHEIKQILSVIKNSNDYSIYRYYHLIKRLIRLAAYMSFKENSLYYGAIIDCYTVAINEHLTIRDNLKNIFVFYQNGYENTKSFRSDDKLLQEITAVVNYLLIDVRILNNAM